MNLRQTFRSCFVLAFLGVVRAAAVAVTGYHVSVTEYGVHWNFFLTLAAVKLIASLVFTLLPHRMAWAMGASNLIAHQVGDGATGEFAEREIPSCVLLRLEAFLIPI